MKAYSLIHEINYIIEHRDLDEVIITPIRKRERPEIGTIVPVILEDKIKKLSENLNLYLQSFQ